MNPQIEDVDPEWQKEWEEIWLPCILTDGKPDLKKIENEMRDLVFIYKQIGKVYYKITGGKLSKPMYYADTIISEHESQIEKYSEEARREATQKVLSDLLSIADAGEYEDLRREVESYELNLQK